MNSFLESMIQKCKNREDSNKFKKVKIKRNS